MSPPINQIHNTEICIRRFDNIDKDIDNIRKEISHNSKILIELQTSVNVRREFDNKDKLAIDKSHDDILIMNNSIKSLMDNYTRLENDLDETNQTVENSISLINNINSHQSVIVEKMTTLAKDVKASSTFKKTIYQSIISGIIIALLIFIINLALSNLLNKNINIKEDLHIDQIEELRGNTK